MTPTIAQLDNLADVTAARIRPSAAAPARFLATLERAAVVLDSAMGTRLIGRGLDLQRDDPCLWNLDRPPDVLDVHRRDAAAGCRACFTNTFGANRAWLARLGRQHDVDAVNRAAVALAQRAVGPGTFLIGDIGPSTADHPGAAGEQAAVLIDSGVDAIVLETFELEAVVRALSEIRTVLEAMTHSREGEPGAGPVPRKGEPPREPGARSAPGGPGMLPIPLIASLWRWPDAIEDAAQRLIGAGASVIGLNCRPGVSRVLPLVRRLAAAVTCPVLVKPGVAPSDPECDATPAAFAAAVPGLLAHNVRLIGGCCGTTEAHVAAIAAACKRVRHFETDPPRGAAP